MNQHWTLEWHAFAQAVPFATSSLAPEFPCLLEGPSQILSLGSQLFMPLCFQRCNYLT